MDEALKDVGDRCLLKLVEPRFAPEHGPFCPTLTANLRSKILDFGGLDSSRILIIRGGIFVSIGKFPDILSHRILVGIILAGKCICYMCYILSYNARCIV